MSEELFKRLEEEVVIECEGSVITDTDDCGERATAVVLINHVPCECEEHCDTLITYVCEGHAVHVDVILGLHIRSAPCELCGEAMHRIDHLRQRQTLLAPTTKEE